MNKFVLFFLSLHKINRFRWFRFNASLSGKFGKYFIVNVLFCLITILMWFSNIVRKVHRYLYILELVWYLAGISEWMNLSSKSPIRFTNQAQQWLTTENSPIPSLHIPCCLLPLHNTTHKFIQHSTAALPEPILFEQQAIYITSVTLY